MKLAANQKILLINPHSGTEAGGKVIRVAGSACHTLVDKPQQQTLSVRISEALRQRLERAKQLMSSKTGESVSTSEIAKQRANSHAAPGIRLHRPGIHYMRGTAAAPESPQPNMTHYGGTVLPSTTTYAIWWGKPSDFPSDERGKIDEFLGSLDGSPYLAIADQYMLGEKAHTHFGGNLFDASALTA